MVVTGISPEWKRLNFMLGYRREAFNAAHRLLRTIVDRPDEIKPVLECQRILVRELFRTEEKIRHYRAKAKALRVELASSRAGRAMAQSIKRQLQWIDRRIEAYQRLAYFWRCFGDGIAFTYLDKFAIKQTFYETANTDPKQRAGALSGKEGLKAEIAVVEMLADQGIPSVLVDLTNSIRHGDVCLLGASDPYLIEVKSSERVSSRGRRQLENIQKLHDFFANDTAPSLRGFPGLRRETIHDVEVNYTDEMNYCIEKASREGYALVSPEPGLLYAAVFAGSSKPDFSGMSRMGYAMAFYLNEFKTGQAWSPYLPFTLSIRKREHLYDFMCGKLFLVVFSDLFAIKALFEDKGYEVTFDVDAEYIWSMKHPPTGAEVRLSNHLFRRIGFEFVAPRWLVDSQCALNERIRGGDLSPDG